MLEKFDIDVDSDCWNWTAGVDGKSRTSLYPILWVNGSSVNVRKLSYEFFVDKTDRMQYIKYTCKNKLCINPQHLIKLTKKLKDSHCTICNKLIWNNSTTKLCLSCFLKLKNKSKHQRVAVSKAQ